MSRRAVLRGAALAGAGMSAAALIGCGSEEETPSGTTTPTTSTSGAGPSAPSGSGGGGTTAPSVSNVPEGAIVPVVEGEPKYGGTFRTAVTATVGQPDMHTSLASATWHVTSERCFELDEWTAELRGVAIEEWEVADDQGLELILKVRPGLTMHDKEPWNGREFNAEDVAWNLERNAGLYAEAEGIPLTSFQRRSMVAYLQSAEAVDDYTVRVTLERPNGAIFNGLAEVRTPMMPKDILDVGFEDQSKFGSFDPYMITDFRPGEREVYQKHPNYYREGRPYFDTYERVVITDRASTTAAFIDGQISVFGTPLPHERQAIEAANPSATYYEWLNTNWDHLRWNMEVEALADARVRKAFSWATDRKEINDGYYGPGWAYTAVTHPGYPEGWSEEKSLTLPGINPDTKEQDRQEAVALLEAAGYPNGAGITLEIVPSTGVTHEENSLRFQDQMNALFPDIVIEIQRPSDQTAFATRQAARDFSAIAYTITVVPDVFLEWHSQYHSDGSRNYGSFIEPLSDELIEKGIAAQSLEERIEIADEFQTRYVEDWNANLIFNIQPERYMLQGNIGGFDTIAGPWGFTGYRLSNKAQHWYEV